MPYDNLDGTQKSFFRLGGQSNPGLRGYSTPLVEARDANNSSLVPLNVSQLQCNSNKLIFNSSEPASGDRQIWGEISSSVLKDGILWTWDGTRWRSPLQSYNVTVYGSGGGFFLPMDTIYNLYVTRLVVSSLISPPNDGSNYWTFGLYRADSANNQTIAGTAINTSANSGNTWVTQSANLNSSFSAATGTRVLFFNASPVGSPGACYAGATVYYHLVRQ